MNFAQLPVHVLSFGVHFLLRDVAAFTFDVAQQGEKSLLQIIKQGEAKLWLLPPSGPGGGERTEDSNAYLWLMKHPSEDVKKFGKSPDFGGGHVDDCDDRLILGRFSLSPSFIIINERLFTPDGNHKSLLDEGSLSLTKKIWINERNVRVANCLPSGLNFDVVSGWLGSNFFKGRLVGTEKKKRIKFDSFD